MNILKWFKRNNKACLDFKAGFDLTDLPVVTFYQGEIKLNFLLDTGCSISIINKSIIPDIEVQKMKGKSSVFGMEGNTIETSLCKINFTYKDKGYDEVFQIIDMEKSFGNIKRESGVTVNGILGTKFFKNNKSILDFEELKAYFK